MHCIGTVSNAKWRGKGQEKDKEIMIGILKFSQVKKIKIPSNICDQVNIESSLLIIGRWRDFL
jgi:hypothetical protein